MWADRVSNPGPLALELDALLSDAAQHTGQEITLLHISDIIYSLIFGHLVF